LILHLRSGEIFDTNISNSRVVNTSISSEETIGVADCHTLTDIDLEWSC
jgi:hypothetical protein